MKVASTVLVALLLAPTIASADLDKSIIRGRIRAHNAETRACYETALKKNPELEGTVHVKFIIAKSGKVIESKGEGLPPVDACVAKIIEKIEFPKNTRENITVTYPFLFQIDRRK